MGVQAAPLLDWVDCRVTQQTRNTEQHPGHPSPRTFSESRGLVGTEARASCPDDVSDPPHFPLPGSPACCSLFRTPTAMPGLETPGSHFLSRLPQQPSRLSVWVGGQSCRAGTDDTALGAHVGLRHLWVQSLMLGNKTTCPTRDRPWPQARPASATAASGAASGTGSSLSPRPLPLPQGQHLEASVAPTGHQAKETLVSLIWEAPGLISPS